MNVLSYFDGMSCGQIALREQNIPITNYFAAELDKFAIEQTRHNFPNTIHLGDVTKIDLKKLPKIDLFIGGSPCQGFSFAGKQLKFDDPRSKLFFDFHKTYEYLKSKNPDIKFLLENVDMNKKELKVISDYMGLLPTNINSSCQSAQNRNRWYWSNIKTKTDWTGYTFTDIQQTPDKGLRIVDILQPENEIDEKFYIKNPVKNFDGMNINGKSNTLRVGGTASQSKKHNFDIIKAPFKKSDLRLIKNTKSINDKAHCILASSYKGAWANGMTLINNGRLRRLTPREFARLQTVPDWYEWVVSDTQAYKQCGNGWTIAIIELFFAQLQL